MTPLARQALAAIAAAETIIATADPAIGDTAHVRIAATMRGRTGTIGRCTLTTGIAELTGMPLTERGIAVTDPTGRYVATLMLAIVHATGMPHGYWSAARLGRRPGDPVTTEDWHAMLGEARQGAAARGAA